MGMIPASYGYDPGIIWASSWDDRGMMVWSPDHDGMITGSWWYDHRIMMFKKRNFADFGSRESDKQTPWFRPVTPVPPPASTTTTCTTTCTTEAKKKKILLLLLHTWLLFLIYFFFAIANNMFMCIDINITMVIWTAYFSTTWWITWYFTMT